MFEPTDREAPSAEVIAAATAIFAQLSSPRIRGPFPCPCADDLARPAYLRELAHWARAAVRRSRRTLGAEGVEDGLEAATRLALAADLLAAVESAPTPQAARALAPAGLKEIEARGRGRPARPSRVLDLMGWLGEAVRANQRPKRPPGVIVRT